MKKVLLAAISGAVLSGAASVATADPIFLDLNNDLDFTDADSITSTFDTFTLNAFSPVSTYYDLDGSGGASTGDFVVDIGSTTVANLNPLAFPDSFEGFNSSWGIDVSWQIFGIAGVAENDGDPNFNGAPETLGALFTGGLVTFTLNDPGNVTGLGDDTLLLEILPTGSSVDLTSGISLDLTGEVISALDDFIFFDLADDRDFADLLELDPPQTISVFADAEIDAPAIPTFDDETPEADAVFELVTGLDADLFDTYTRTTDLSSPNIEFSVPAPATLGLIGLGLLGLGARSRKRA